MWYAWHQSMTTCMNELFSHGHSLLAMAFSRPWTLEYGVQYTRPVSGPRRRGARPSRRGPSHVRLAACLGRSARRAKRRHQHTCGYAVATYTCAPLSRRTRERAHAAASTAATHDSRRCPRRRRVGHASWLCRSRQSVGHARAAVERRNSSWRSAAATRDVARLAARE